MRKIAFLLAVLLLVSFASCAKQETDENGEQTSQTQESATETGKQTTTSGKTTTVTTKASEENPLVEKMEISWLCGVYTSHLYEEGRWDELELEELFNVDLKMWNILIDSGNMEQVEMMLAAGDVPDYGFYYKSAKYMNDNGLSRTITLDTIKQHYPGFYSLLENDPIGFKYNLLDNTVDEYIGLSSYTPQNRQSYWVPVWRLDWLESVGIELNDLVPMQSYIYPEEWSNSLYFSDTIFTIDEVKEILRAFTEDDPDGNGADDTYGSPFANSNYDGYISEKMFGFDKNGNHFYRDDTTGDLVPYYAYTPYRDNLMFLLEMLDKGYIRWVPGENVFYLELRDIWNTGKTGYINTIGPPRILGYGYGNDGFEWPPASILLNTDPDAVFVITRPPGAGKWVPYALTPWGKYTHIVGGEVSDEKLTRLLQLLDYANFGDNWPRYRWGIEGVHYKWAGEAFFSSLIQMDPESIPTKYAGKGTKVFGQFGNEEFTKDIRTYFDYDDCIVQMVDYYEERGGYFDNKNWIYPEKLYDTLTMTSNNYDAFKQLRDTTIDDISAVHNDFSSRVWDGQIGNIAAEWEQYINQIYAAGLEKWVEFWNDDSVEPLMFYLE